MNEWNLVERLKSLKVEGNLKNLLPYRLSALVLSKAFTMAEILLSLTIIGVVAAITLPSLTGNVNEKAWNAQKKALYARMSQAIALMGNINGYGQYQGTYNSANDCAVPTVDTAAETFVTDGLSKVLKINNICDNAHLDDCGLPSKIKTLEGKKINFPKKLSEINTAFTSTFYDVKSNGTSVPFSNPQNSIDTKSAAFETQNGESIAIFYNPFCLRDIPNQNHIALPMICANFVYDLNGKKGPNTFGKDIGIITALYPTDSSVVAPNPLPLSQGLTKGYVWTDALAHCESLEDARLPNRDELTALVANRNLLITQTDFLADSVIRHNWTSTVVSEDKVWTVSFRSGMNQHNTKNGEGRSTLCIKR